MNLKIVILIPVIILYSGKTPPKEWPSSGEIIFQNMSLRYCSNGQYVLKDLSFQINPTEKVIYILYFLPY